VICTKVLSETYENRNTKYLRYKHTKSVNLENIADKGNNNIETKYDYIECSDSDSYNQSEQVSLSCTVNLAPDIGFENKTVSECSCKKDKKSKPKDYKEQFYNAISKRRKLDTNTIVKNIRNHIKNKSFMYDKRSMNYYIKKSLTTQKLKITYINPMVEFRYYDYMFP